MDYNLIRHLRLASIVIMFCGLFFQSVPFYFIGMMGFLGFLLVPYLRIERTFYEYLEKHKKDSNVDNNKGDITGVGFKKEEKKTKNAE